MNLTKIGTLVLTIAFLAVACGEATEDPSAAKGELDPTVFDGGKSDLGDKAKLIDDIALDSEIQGQFDPKVRVYGYSLEAKAGAKLTVALAATAGSGAARLDDGEELDTMLAVYRYDDDVVGERIAQTDDNDAGFAAPPIDFEADRDGVYLIAFMSYDDTGKGKYTVSVGCDGTDLQCRRPDFDKPCKEGELYIQGGQVEKDTTWATCDVILLEPTVVAEGATLTIKPGVTVKGNFLSENDRHFGTVTLQVNGLVQAEGTEEHPIAFTSLTERGWGGIVINSPANSFTHIVVEKANTAFSVRDGGVVTIDHSLLEGGLTLGEGDDAEVVRSANGIHTQNEAVAHFTRAVVKGFGNGILADDTYELVIEDSIIRDNDIAMRVNGAGATTSCGTNTNVTTFRDPKIIHTDIFNNGRGIFINGSDVFVQVEKSNLINNDGLALEVRGTGLHEESYLDANNIHGNNGATAAENTVQVRSFHRQGALALRSNYWNFISDPALSASWDSRCNAEVDFTNFSPTSINDAGPREDNVKQEIFQQGWQQQSQSN